MRKIRAEFVLGVRADTAQARADINRFREVASREGMRLGVDVGLAQAKTDMDAFRERQRRDGLAIKVDVEDAEAKAKLAALRAQQRGNNVRVKVDADTSGVLDKIESLDKAFSSILGAVGSGLKMNLTIAGIGELPAATLMVAQLTGAVEQLAQAGLVLPGVFAGIGASVGTLALGLNGIKDAYDAVSKAAKPTLSEQASQAREVTSATNAHRNAVADEAQAERDRTRAVKDARHALEDLNLQLRGGKISEQQAINNALRQRRDLQRDMAKGQIKDQLDLQQRLLDIQEADQGVAEAHQRNIETQEKWNDAQQKGIANSDAVVQANEHVARAQQNVAQTSDALATAINKPYAAVNDAMANLSPNAQKVITTLQGMQSRFLDFGNTIQDKVFAGVSDSVKTLIDSDLPNLQTGMGGIATAWNGTIKQLMSSLGSDSSKGLLDRILGNTAKAQEEFNKAIAPIVHGIGTLTAAGTDALPRLADAIGSIATRFDNFITAADKDGSLGKWINEGLTGFAKLGDTLLNVGSIIHSISQAAGGGDGLLTVLSKGSKELADFLKSTEGQNKLKEWFAEGAREMREHIIPLLQSLPGLFSGIVRVGTDIANTVVPPLRDIAHYLSQHKELVKDVTELFIGWKTLNFATGIIGQLQKISDLLGSPGTPGTKGKGKGGKGRLARGGKGILGGLVLMEGLNLADDALTPDSDSGDNKPPPPPPGHQIDAGQVPVGQSVPFNNIPVVTPDAAKDYAKGAGSGFVMGGPLGALINGTLSAANNDPSTLSKEEQQFNQIVDAIPLLQGDVQRNFVKPLADVLGISVDDFLKMPRADLHKRWMDALHNQPPAPPAAPSPPLFGPQLGQIPHYDRGGATPGSAGPLPGGGYHAVVHPDEWMLNPLGRRTVGDQFAAAANRGVLDPMLLPHFDVGGPGDGRNLVDGYGNPVTPGMLPGPSDPSVYQPIGPNPMASTGVSSALGSVVSGLSPVLQNVTSMIPGLGGQRGGQAGGSGFVPGLWGLGAAMQGGDAGMQLWGQQTGDWLANWGASTLAKLGGALYQKGFLGFFGLENSILSPSNSWFQAGAQSLGVFNNLAPLFGWGSTDASGLQIGSDTVGVGANGESISVPTFGTSGVAGGTGAGVLNQLSKASSLGGANANYTPDFLLANGIAPLYTRTTDKDGNSAAQIPDWANKLAAAFNLTATSHSDSTLHGGQSGKGDSTNTNAGWAFDFSGKPEDEQKFADFIQSNLSGQTLQAIWQNPGTGKQLGIAGGQLLARDQYYTTKGGAYADHTDHVHWATDVAPNLWDQTGKSLLPGLIPDRAPAGSGAPGTLPVPLPAGVSGGGRGAGLNLALAAAKGGDKASNKALAQALFTQYFPASEWSAFDTLEMHEAGYNNTAKNPSSTAYGMGQFLDSTWGSYGSKTSDPATQLRYMLQYIKNRYGTPSAAWAQYYNHPGGIGWYSEGGASHGPGGPKGDKIPAFLSDNEHVFTSEDVNAMGGQQNVYAFRAALHRADGGDVSAGLVPQPPKPVFPLPNVQHITAPPRASAVIPSAPTTPLPAPIGAPAPPAAPVQPAAQQPDQQQQQPRVTVGAPNSAAPGPGELNHNLAAINTGIASGASTLGNIAATAASMGMAASGGGAGAGAGLASSMIAGLFQQGGKIATNAVNIGSSLLVGNVPGSFGDSDRAYGHAVRAQQKVPVTAPSGDVTHNTFNGMDVNRVFQELDIRQAQAQQARMAKYGG